VTHEYPANDFYDSVTETRVDALGGFGFTERQREFLVTVMVHSGCFLERHYVEFPIMRSSVGRGAVRREIRRRMSIAA
jgi:hypothetical protein